MTDRDTRPPPGWYPDHSGHVRWWDGGQWGPYAPPPAPSDTGTSLAIVSHLGMFAGGFVLPLVIYLTEGKKNEFVRHHAQEALNFQITYLLVWLAAAVFFFASFAASTWGEERLVGFFFPPVFPLMFLVWAAGAAAAVVGAVRASQHQWWRYPVSVRFVKGSHMP